MCLDVLHKRFPQADVRGDIREVDRLPRVDVQLVGFPCTPYSQVGRTKGLRAGRWHIAQFFRVLDATRYKPSYVVLENVPFIVRLSNGSAVRHLLAAFEDRGYRWAYRIVDTSSFGLPQRRRRWILVATRADDPASILLAQHSEPLRPTRVTANGFYWSEGNRGIGWAENAIPPLKVGSKWGIATPPAIWSRASGRIVVPRITAAERLQGFDAGWTDVDSTTIGNSGGQRWRMVGNAVSVPIARWVASRIKSHPHSASEGEPLKASDRLPSAAFFDGKRRYRSCAGTHPVSKAMEPLMTFLDGDVVSLSAKATRGFRLRYERSPLRKNDDFIRALRDHESSMRY